MTQHDNLPPLPDGKGMGGGWNGGKTFPLYTADQMREYAREAIAESEAESMPAAWKAGKARAYEEMGQTVLPWRGIDSAPKDGTNLVLAYPASPNGWVEGWFHSGYWCEQAGVMQPQPEHYLPVPPLPEVKP